VAGGEAACKDYAAYLGVRVLDVQTPALYIHTQALNIHTRVLYTHKRTLYILKKALNIPSRQPGICGLRPTQPRREIGRKSTALPEKRCVNTIWPLRIHRARHRARSWIYCARMWVRAQCIPKGSLVYTDYDNNQPKSDPCAFLCEFSCRGNLK